MPQLSLPWDDAEVDDAPELQVRFLRLLLLHSKLLLLTNDQSINITMRPICQVLKVELLDCGMKRKRMNKSVD
ncbi:hypothetical protein EJB05_38497, partial [Eragrostis curvula]